MIRGSERCRSRCFQCPFKAPRRGIKNIAKGNALGNTRPKYIRPERAKDSFNNIQEIRNSFALSRRVYSVHLYPGRCPGLCTYCPFRALKIEVLITP